jgi:hypothetical protein
MSVKRDERLGFTGGFRLPGMISVLKTVLRSQYKEQQEMFPVESLFPPRVEEDGKTEFRFQVSQTVYAAQKLTITCSNARGGVGW